MRLHRLSGRTEEGYTTFGCVWGKGEALSNSFLVTDEDGEAVPVQSRITAYWPDGSVKWSAHTADAVRMGSSIEVKPLLNQEKDGMEQAGIRIRKQENCYKVETGRLSMEVPLAENCRHPAWR